MVRARFVLVSLVAAAHLGVAFEDEDIGEVSLLQQSIEPIPRNASLATPAVTSQLPQDTTQLAEAPVSGNQSAPRLEAVVGQLPRTATQLAARPVAGNQSAPLLKVATGQLAQNATQLAAAPVTGIQSGPHFLADFVADDQPQPPQPTTLAASTSGSASGGSKGHRVSMRKVAAEYIAMTLFVATGCGSAMAIARDEGSAWVLQVAMAFGFTATALIYSLGRYSGGQINCAVTLALWVSGEFGFGQAILNFVAQMLGSVTGALCLCVIFPPIMDKTGCVGSNEIREGFGLIAVLFGELLMTFMLCMVVLESGQVAGPASGISSISIGFAIFIAHCVLIPIDGCSINPTRSFGPALISAWSEERGSKSRPFKRMWVFWVGPLLGALIAAAVHALLKL